MLHALADAPRAELGQDVVETLAAKVERLRIGAIPQPEDAVANAREVGTLRLEILVKVLGIVRDVALAVG